MGPPSYMRSVVDRNVVMGRIPVRWSPIFVGKTLRRWVSGSSRILVFYKIKLKCVWKTIIKFCV